MDSIQLVSRPLEHIDSVAVTPESATSVVLTKVLLPDAVLVPLDKKAEAKLLIGDAALRSAFEDPTPHHDLGKLWLDRTGLPMVFAVWACPDPPPRASSRSRRRSSRPFGSRGRSEKLAFEASVTYSCSQVPRALLREAALQLRPSRARAITFFELARDVGELERVPELRCRPRGGLRLSGNGNAPGNEPRRRDPRPLARGERLTDDDALVLLARATWFASAAPPTSCATARSTRSG